ncbi:DUF6461 domain-containing protein [Streptomyces griseorubiginosus]
MPRDAAEGQLGLAHSTDGGKPIHLFHWFEDGDRRTTFEGPAARHGSTPDELVPLLPDVGFPLTLGGEHGDSAPEDDGKAAVLALVNSPPRGGPAWSSTSPMPMESALSERGQSRAPKPSKAWRPWTIRWAPSAMTTPWARDHR